MPLLNYTTKIEPEQTIGEIQRLLSKHSVMAMMTEYDGANVSAVSFKMNLDGEHVSYRLPCNWRAVLQVFKNNPAQIRNLRLKGGTLEEQAIRTAWRVIKDWIESQLALVEINMVTIPQIFLPYTIMRDNRTLYEHVLTNPKFLLE